MISIIIPTLNEENYISKTLRHLSELMTETDFEIIISDGFSSDKTVELASSFAKVISAEKGKSTQLNAGAKLASGDILFFVHADMYVPPGALKKIEQAIYENGFDGGGFLNVFDRHNQQIKRLGRIMYLGLNNNGHADKRIFFGDNGIFVRKKTFEELGGFKEIPIMEDYDFSIRMLSKYKVCLIKEPRIIVDARRHVKDGFLKTRIKWMLIKRLFLFGVSPKWLNDWYKDIR